MNNLIRNFCIGNKIIFNNNQIVEILNYAGTVSCLTNNGVAEMQLYNILYNNEVYYASDTGLLNKDPDIFKKVIANIGYRGCASYKDYAKEYEIWKNIIYRCYWSNNNIYQYYGALGVTVDPKWHCFEFFLYDLINMRSYDTFRSSNRRYDMDISKQNNIPYSDRCYMVGKAILKPLSQTDVLQALDKAKATGTTGESGTYIDSTIIKESNTNKVTHVDYNPLPNGDYPYEAYNQVIINPPSLPIPGNDDIGYDRARILGGIINYNTIIKPTTTAGKNTK